MSIQNGCVLTHEGIEYLCGLIRDINGLDTNLIDDLNIKSNGTFSSVRINTLLNALKTDCNDFANSLVSNISRLELKIVTNEADIIEHNKLYLIKKAGETSYSQYVIVTNDSGVDEKILLGTTDINISDYYTITQADTKFTLKADFNSLKTEVDKVKTTLGTDSLNTTSQTVTGGVNELKTDLTTHTNDTDIHITSAERTAWNKKANDNEVVKKTDITTTIDSTSTNTQVPGAKSVWDSLYKIRDPQVLVDANKPTSRICEADLTTLNTPAKEGLTNGESSLIISVKNQDFWNGQISITMAESEVFVRSVRNVGTWTKWRKLCSTGVADVPTTKININASYISDANCYYEVKNGICYVNFLSGTYVVSSQLDGVTLATGLPKPSAPEVAHTYILWAGLPSQQVILFVKNDGRLVLHASVNSNGGCIYTTFSYPVKE